MRLRIPPDRRSTPLRSTNFPGLGKTLLTMMAIVVVRYAARRAEAWIDDWYHH